jgi:hypothetical protein
LIPGSARAALSLTARRIPAESFNTRANGAVFGGRGEYLFYDFGGTSTGNLTLPDCNLNTPAHAMWPSRPATTTSVSAASASTTSSEEACLKGNWRARAGKKRNLETQGLTGMRCVAEPPGPCQSLLRANRSPLLHRRREKGRGQCRRDGAGRMPEVGRREGAGAGCVGSPLVRPIRRDPRRTSPAGSGIAGAGVTSSSAAAVRGN